MVKGAGLGDTATNAHGGKGNGTMPGERAGCQRSRTLAPGTTGLASTAPNIGAEGPAQQGQIPWGK